MADHSCQIGADKVFVVLAVRASEMPPPGTALKHEDLHVLIVEPGTQWKTEDVAKSYEKLAETYGVPLALVVDGAPELRESMGATSSTMATEVKERLLEFTRLGDAAHRWPTIPDQHRDFGVEFWIDCDSRLRMSGSASWHRTAINQISSPTGTIKQLERQHSKGGLTSLLAAFGSLLRPVTPQSVKRDFARTSVKQMRAWVTKNLGTTLTSKRQTAYKEFANAT